MTIAEKHSDEIIRLYCEEKLSAQKVADKLGCSSASVSTYIRNKGLTRPKLGSQRPLTKEKQEFDNYVIKRYVNDLASIKKIAEETGYSECKVARTLSKRNLIRNTINYVDDPNMTQRVMEIYSDPYVNVHEVARRVGISSQSVTKILNKNNIKITQKKNLDPNAKVSAKGVNYEEIMEFFREHTAEETCEKFSCSRSFLSKTQLKFDFAKQESYNYNTDYFKKVDTHEKAYILGFLASDGNSSRTTLSMGLKDDDEEILEKINREFTPDKPLYRSTNNFGTNVVSMMIHNKEILEDAISLGIVPRKTFLLQPQDWMTGQFANSACLGLFNGDGSIHSGSVTATRANGQPGTTYKRWVFCFTGLKCICETMRDVIKTNTGVEAKIYLHHGYKENDEKQIHNLVVSGNRAVETVCRWMHRDSKLHMERKYNRFMELVEYNKETDLRAIERKRISGENKENRRLKKNEYNRIRDKRKREEARQAKFLNLSDR